MEKIRTKRIKKKKKKWRFKRGDDSQVGELSFATLATFKRKGNFLDGTRKKSKELKRKRKSGVLKEEMIVRWGS